MIIPGFNGLAVDPNCNHLKNWLFLLSDNILIHILISVTEFSQSNHKN